MSSSTMAGQRPAPSSCASPTGGTISPTQSGEPWHRTSCHSRKRVPGKGSRRGVISSESEQPQSALLSREPIRHATVLLAPCPHHTRRGPRAEGAVIASGADVPNQAPQALFARPQPRLASLALSDCLGLGGLLLQSRAPRRSAHRRRAAVERAARSPAARNSSVHRRRLGRQRVRPDLPASRARQWRGPRGRYIGGCGRGPDRSCLSRRDVWRGLTTPLEPPVGAAPPPEAPPDGEPVCARPIMGSNTVAAISRTRTALLLEALWRDAPNTTSRVLKKTLVVWPGA